MSFNRKLAFLATALGSMGFLAACASFPTMTIAPEHAASGAKAGADGQAAAGRNGALKPATPQASNIPAPAPTSQPTAPVPPATAEQIAAIATDQPINASLPPQPLAQFLNTAFNDVLKIPYSLGPDIATRTQIITLNAPPTTTKRAYLGLLQTTLRSYGLVMSIRNGGVLITDEAGGAAPGRGGATTIVRSRSSADTPLAARSVMQIFQLVALQADAVQPLVQNTLGSSVSISVDSAANALVIQGSGRMVANAVDLIHNLDVPAFAGAQVVRLEPLYWNAADFATALQSALQAEGYIASADPLGPKAIMVLPLVSTSQVLVFAADKATMARVQYWDHELDQPSAVGAQNTTFVYDVQNTSATTLGQMLIAAGAQARLTQASGTNQPAGAFPGAGRAGANVGGQVNNAAGRGGAANNGIAGGGLGGAVGANGRAGGGVNNGIAGAAPNSTTNALNRPTGANTQMNASGPSPGGGSITVDDAGNRIVFTGSPSEYAALHTLLQRLDSPTREVLVEVTVAEVTLTDETRAGLDFFFSANHAGSIVSGGTSTFTAPTNGLPGAGIGLGSNGATLSFSNASGDLRADFNAFAQNNKVNVLSRPHLTATSGSSAEIEVGDQVPIITSQQAASTTTAGNTDLLQTVQYRQTGVTLTITPIIYGDDRVDITIDQEVANVENNPNTAIGSPIISSRSVSTTLTLADGRSAVLGGLMQDSYSKENTGVPFLKDIPVLGQAFRNDDINGAKTELVVLITPFIIRDANDMSNLANQMTKDINKAFQTGRGASYTLTPFALGRDFGLGGPDPIVTGASLQRPDTAPNGPAPTPTVNSPLAPPPNRP